MYDIMPYMADFPKKFNQPLKVKLISAVINKSPENSQELENLLAEKRQIANFNKQVGMALKSIIKSNYFFSNDLYCYRCISYYYNVYNVRYRHHRHLRNN